VQIRILAGVGAWLLGATTATAGSLLAVSLLGQGIADSPGQQLTTSAVNRALAQEAGEATVGSPAPAPSATRQAGTRAAATPVPAVQPRRTEVSPVVRTSASRPAAMPPPAAAAADGTVLTSPGGTALAECGTAGSYLVSWSPTQGYETGDVIRGPAATTRVTFESDADSVTMVVTCSSGTPAATSSVGDSAGSGE
jgi:hypothetical protein